MRIAILAPHAGYVVGGAEAAAKGLRKHLLSENECEIFSLARSSWTTKVPGIKGNPYSTIVTKLKLNYLNHLVPYIYIIKKYALSELSYSYHLYPILARFNPDIIINFNSSILALFCKYYRHKYKVPFLHVGQAGCIYAEVKSAMAKPDVYVALTPVAKDFIERRVANVRVEVISNGVDINLFSANGPRFPRDYFRAKSNTKNLNLKPPFILSTSRLVKEKRLDLLIKAVSRLERGTLILVGYGGEKERLFKLGSKILKDRLIFLDTLSQEELAKIYRSCDVFSLPSENEPFGNVLIEAMASGLPVVATNNKVFEWIVGNKGGILVDVTDSQAYARALYEAWKKNFGDSPQQQAKKFSWPLVAQKYIEICKDILRSKNKSQQ